MRLRQIPAYVAPKSSGGLINGPPCVKPACFISSFSPTASTPRSLNSRVAAATIARRFSAACSLDTPKACSSIHCRLDLIYHDHVYNRELRSECHSRPGARKRERLTIRHKFSELAQCVVSHSTSDEEGFDISAKQLTKTIVIDIVFPCFANNYRFCAGTQRLHFGDRHDQVPRRS